MPRFFIRGDQVDGDVVTVLGEDAHHISRSLRMAAGERITVCDMQKNEYECELTEFLPDRVKARIVTRMHADTEPPYVAQVFQALPKGDKLDAIIQKAVECGASELTVFESERCVARIKDAAEDKKLERRRRIATEAAKQCGRGVLPTVHPSCRFDEAVKIAAKADVPLFCYEGDGTEPLPRALKNCLRAWREKGNVEAMPTVSVMIGSEGGFSLDEVARAKDAGMIPVGLGKRILRTETAASFVLSCLSYELELSNEA